MGALPITSSKSTSLTALQRPLKDLYFKWRALRNLGQTNLPGTLEINDTGLTVQYIREMHKGVQEIFNPFPTIAVWAAVKFVHRRDLVQSEPQVGPRGGVVQSGNYVLHRYAFLPLISDPEGNDKSRLFHELDGEHEVELAADSPHPPLFACVMRRTGGQKILECHGFVCHTSEDAIIIAANLYQALLETMKKQKQKQKTDSLRRSESKQKEGSTTDDQGSVRTTSLFSDSDATTTNTNTPIRPPRRKKTTRASNDGSVTSSVLQRRRSTRSSVRSNRSNKSTRSAKKRVANGAGHNISFVPDQPFRRSNTRLGRSESGRRSDFSRRSSRRGRSEPPPVDSGPSRDLAPPPASMKGDVYTRVAIPRSKSFMNVSSQYNLQELFRELKEKEGVESIDDVLKKIISPNGISFNEIKPVYRELLLKLAMTMSQDEIFQRSKNIIHQEKKKMKSKKSKTKSTKSYNTSGSEQSTLSSFLRMTFSSSKNQSQQQQASSKGGTLEPSRKSISGYDTGISLLSKSTSSNKVLTKADISGPIPLNGTTSQTSRGLQSASTKTPLMPRAIHSKVPQMSEKPPAKAMPEEIDDAYMSCSECGYESVCTYDSCSCSSKIAPQKKIQTPLTVHKNHSRLTTTLSDPDKIQVKHDDTESLCDCDADSCVSSDKCYCSLRGDPRQKLQPKHKLPSKLVPILSDDGETSSCCSSHSSCGNTTINRSGEIISTDSGTDTTCYSVRHISHKPQINHHGTPSRDISLSRVESPQTAWKRNSNLSQPNLSSSPSHQWPPHQAESCIGSEYSDALPLSQLGLSSASVISSGSSSINSCKICQVNHFKHHGCCMSDDEGHSSPLSCELHRKNSGGSGYQSNDSYSSPQTSPSHSHHHGHHPQGLQQSSSRVRSLSQDNLARLLSHGSGGSGCSCSSSCSGSLASRGSHQHNHGRPRLSLAKSSSHLLMDIDNNVPLSQQKRSLSQQKVLMVQAVDRAGKVILSF